MKRFISLLLSIVMITFLLVPTNLYAETSLNITGTPITGKNYMHLEWTNLGPGYTYTVYAKGEDERVYQSIPSKTNITVLNVYPDAGNNLETWMEANGYGKGLISVDPVSISSFNSNPESYMKDAGGNWKYDVIYFGGYDSNNRQDISLSAKSLVEAYIKAGYGVLFGHDTLSGIVVLPNFNSLASLVNINVNTTATYGNTTINVAKEGLLTNYPWIVGSNGTILTIPMSHSGGQFAMGDIWMTYTSNSYSGASAGEVTNLDGKTGTTNFYLTTWNNCAMIQTGHSNGAATEDEQKLLANTLFYLAQLTKDNFCDDHKSQDFAAPDSVNISSASNDSKNLTVTYSEPNDNGTSYEYYVKASNGNSAQDITSNTASAINISGLAGYSYAVDNKEDTEPDDKIDTTGSSISVSLSGLDLSKPIYTHIKAIDYAGNCSKTTHYKYTYARPSLNVTATPIAVENYVHLDWTDLGPGYIYTVYAKGEDERVYQSIPSKTNVKVLNVYPGAGNNLKDWIEAGGYGKGLISVDTVDLGQFNNNPESYMKDTNGKWKYDVTYFGAYDANNYRDISTTAKILIETYIKDGYGVLFGHDTLTGLFSHPNFNSLASHVNINVNTGATYGTTTINVAKEGLLTNYPWSVGGTGTLLTIPLSHSYGEFAMGDVWMTYTSNTWSGASEITSLDNKVGTSNFYLTTWNNCAMIQTGHSNGAATEDEQKLLANTLFYLAQLTKNNFCDDHKSQDFAAPDSVNISSASNDSKNLTVTYSEPNDNGTSYEYYVKASNGNSAEDITSNTASAINISGLAGYSYAVDSKEDTEPDDKIDTTGSSISVSLSELNLTTPSYIHIKAIDYAGNCSKTAHYKYTYTNKLRLDPNSVSLKKGSKKQLNATVTSYFYKNSDVKWTSSDEKVATVDSNGNVSAVGIGKSIIKAQIEGTDISDSCEITAFDDSYSGGSSSGSSSSGGSSSSSTKVIMPEEIPAGAPIDLTISITADKTVYIENEEIIFTVKYKNMLENGTGPFKITAQIPENTKVSDPGEGEASGSAITWQIPSLTGKGSGQKIYKVKIGDIPKSETVISDTAEISGVTGLINTEDDKSTVKVMLRTQKYGDISHKAYIVGYPGSEFRPENQITRAEAAAMFARIMGLPLTKSEKEVYSDVDNKHWARGSIEAVTNVGVFKGYEDNLFHPEARITRAEFATVIARYLSVGNIKPFEEHYNDLRGHWAQNYIEEIKRLKIIEGYEDGTFRPDLGINRSEAVTMINKMLFRGPLKVESPTFKDVAATNWFFGQVEEAAIDHKFNTNDGIELLSH